MLEEIRFGTLGLKNRKRITPRIPRTRATRDSISDLHTRHDYYGALVDWHFIKSLVHRRNFIYP
jgi:hypothetical protein